MIAYVENPGSIETEGEKRMVVVILAGGLGTRIGEESHLKPKPMIEIGEMPILWHLMKTYSHYGFHEFIICCGYKQHMIKKFFADYYCYASDIVFDFSGGEVKETISAPREPWKVTVVDTGLNTMTGGRIKRIKEYVGDEPFMLTYGDGVSDVDIRELCAFHEKHGKLVTMTTVKPAGRFGFLELEDNRISSFREKSSIDVGYINGGFMVCQPEIFDYIEGDDTIFERQPLEKLAEEGNLMAFKHHGFWQCMDTLRDKQSLEERWEANNAPWKLW